MRQLTSIIILSFNTLPITKLCIESIRRHTAKDIYEIIVVDNASHDGSVEWLEKQADIRLINNDWNAGFSVGCNQGLKIAKGSELLLLNSDTIVTHNWLSNLCTALYSSPKIGAVGCMTNCSVNDQQIEGPYDNIDGLDKFAAGFNKSDSAKWVRKLLLIGFCFLFKREVYEKIGPLDEIFTPGNFEDDDYSLRIWQAGYEMLLCKDTFIHHFGKASFISGKSHAEREENVEKYNALIGRHAQIFRNKWTYLGDYKNLEPDDIVENLRSRSIPPLDKALAAFQRGNHAFRQRKWIRALDEYNKVLTIQPGNKKAIINAALVARKLGDDETAKALAAAGNAEKEVFVIGELIEAV